MTSGPADSVAAASSVWRLRYVCPDPPLERYSSTHTFAIVDVRRGAYLALEVRRFPRLRVLSRVRGARPAVIWPMFLAGDRWQGLSVTEGGRSSEPTRAGGPGEGPFSAPVRALWMVSLHDPARSPLTVLVEDGPLVLVHGPPGERERWRVSGHAVAEGIRVDFDVDYDLSGFRARLIKIIFGGCGWAHAAIHRLDPHPPKRFLLTPATEEDLAVFQLPPSRAPAEHWYREALSSELSAPARVPRDWTQARRELARLQVHDGWRSLSQ
jgi:hypothetical protein